MPTIYFSIISTLLVDGLGLNVEWWDWSKHFPFALWFLPVLYFTELVAWLICNKIMSKVSYVIFLLALWFLPHLLSHFSVELVYSISSIPIAAFFYLIGYSIKTIVRNFKSHLWGAIASFSKCSDCEIWACKYGISFWPYKSLHYC